MAIPKDVMAHMSDNPHVDSEPVCLQHLLDLWSHAVTAYALERHPEAKVGQQWTANAQEAAEINDLLLEVNAEFSKHHSHAWLKQVTYTIDTTGEGTISVPDEYQYVMDYLIAIRNATPELKHSAIPSRVTEQ